MRRPLVVVPLFALLAGCGLARATVPPLLLVGTSGGVAVVDLAAREVVLDARDAVASHDGNVVVRTFPMLEQTRLEAVTVAGGTTVWQRDVDGELAVSTVSADGGRVALVPPIQMRDGYPSGRGSTPLVIAGAGFERRFELEGNVVPEAFSTDGSSLFVLEYLPALQPDRYRVRRLDLRTGDVEAVTTPDGHRQEAMRGTARVQAMAPDGRRLYTLYTVAETQAAFVHVLDLQDLWAHCVDLPPGIGVAEASVAIGVSPDSTRVFVADAVVGTLAEIDASVPAVVRNVALELPSSDESPVLAADAGRVYVGRGAGLAILDAVTLRRRASWTMPGVVTGIRAAGRLDVGLRDRILTVDRGSGRVLDTVRPVGLPEIEGVGGSSAGVPPGRKEIACAC